MLARPLVKDGGQTREVLPGDILAGGEVIGTLATNGAGTLTAALIANGIVQRTTVAAAFTDTTDTANNIIIGLAGNNGMVQTINAGGTTTNVQSQPDVVPGSTFRFLYQNNTSAAMTLAAGEGVTLAGIQGVPANSWAEYLVKVNCSAARQSLQCTNLTASKTITLANPQPMGTIVPGMSLSGTNITTGTLVVGITLNGSGQISAVTTDTNSTGANATSVAIVFSPQVSITGLNTGSMTALAPAKYTTSAAGTSTALAGDFTGAAFVNWQNTANGAVAYTTRTAAQMIADLPNAQIGQSWMVRITNTGNNTVTLTAGVGVTLTGTMTVATNTFRDFVVTITAAGAVTFQSVAVGTIS